MKAAIYTRVSSPGQATADAASLEAQEHTARTICEREGWEVVEHYQDAGRSATRDSLDNRPAMQRLLKDATAGRFGHLVVYHQDRLARNADVSAEIAVKLRRAKVSIQTERGPVDLEEFGGKLLYFVTGLLAEEEARRIRERCDNGRRTYAERGNFVYWQQPFGYRWIPGDLRKGKPNRLEPVASELATVRVLFETAARRGLSIRGLVAELNRRALTTRPGGQWCPGDVADMLKDPRYMGRWRVWTEAGQDWFCREDLIPEPAVTERQWRAAQKARAHHRQRTRRPMRHAHLLNGFLFCVECGSPMVGHQISDTPCVRYYVCSKKKANVDKPCRGRYVAAEPLEAEAWGLVEELAAHPEAVQRYADQTRALRLPELREEAERIARAVADAEARLGRLVLGYETGDLTGDEVARRRPQIAADVEAWQERLAEIEPMVADAELAGRAIDTVTDTLAGLGERVCDLGLEERRSLLGQLDFRVELACENWGQKSTERTYDVLIRWAGSDLATRDIVPASFELPT
ncbi:MAG TPA: recombinase family protein [Armatimonadota bacterium]|nr:recombinase family protein [Armatimonadota bacterium]